MRGFLSRFPAPVLLGFALGTHGHCGFVPAFPTSVFYTGHADKNIPQADDCSQCCSNHAQYRKSQKKHKAEKYQQGHIRLPSKFKKLLSDTKTCLRNYQLP
nr:MAG TPA: hypothetical protein [Caudoviricetes sp.]